MRAGFPDRLLLISARLCRVLLSSDSIASSRSLFLVSVRYAANRWLAFNAARQIVVPFADVGRGVLQQAGDEADLVGRIHREMGGG